MADWERVEADLRWCLKEGRGVEGRDVLFDALQMTDRERAYRALGQGFLMSFRDDPPTSNFLACSREDRSRLYDLARAVVGLPPMP